MSSSEANMDKLHAALHAPLDDKLYRLDAEETAFYKAKTGIDDDDKLKEHIVQVQRDAYQVCVNFVSVGLCGTTKPRSRMAGLPVYVHSLVHLRKVRCHSPVPKFLGPMTH